MGMPCDVTVRYSDLKGGPSSVYVGTGSTLTWGAGMIDADPLFLDPAGGDYHLQQDPCQPGIVNPCVDAGNNMVDYNGYFSCSTKTNNDGDEGVVDMGFHYGIFTIVDLFLNIDTCFLPQLTGGTVDFKLSAGEDNKYRNSLLLGSASGTEPGCSLPGGIVTLASLISLLRDPVSGASSRLPRAGFRPAGLLAGARLSYLWPGAIAGPGMGLGLSLPWPPPREEPACGRRKSLAQRNPTLSFQLSGWFLLR